jgi:hypothetical protein
MRRAKIWTLLVALTLMVNVPVSFGRSEPQKVTVTLVRWPYT